MYSASDQKELKKLEIFQPACPACLPAGRQAGPKRGCRL